MNGSTREHIIGADCWCEPVLEYTTESGTQVWLHIEADGERPPAAVVAEAIACATFGDDEE